MVAFNTARLYGYKIRELYHLPEGFVEPDPL